jgi:hypothetical protein
VKAGRGQHFLRASPARPLKTTPVESARRDYLSTLSGLAVEIIPQILPLRLTDQQIVAGE